MTNAMVMSSFNNQSAFGSRTNNFDTLTVPDQDALYESDVSVSENASSVSETTNNSNCKHSQTPSDATVSISIAQSLPPEKVRWFYKEAKLWVPFCGYDSLRLETKYLELENQTEMTSDSLQEKVVVRGDLYEVDVWNRKGYPIYWTVAMDSCNSFPILRGTWFKENSWQPLDNEQFSLNIEEKHMKFYGSISDETDIDVGIAQHLTKKLHLNIKTAVVDGYHVDWYDQDNIYYYIDSASRFIRYRLGLTKVGSKICRGYKKDARIEDKLPDITHLVFVIHGIGQKMKGVDIVQRVNKLRSLYRSIARKYFSMLERRNERLEFFPVEWRTSLVLDGNAVDLITPNRNKTLRNALNSTGLDVLYYSSPKYRPEMIESLRSELIRLYSMFCARSPHFESKGGKVSVLAHSLGNVLLYDILTNWSPAQMYEYLDQMHEVNHNRCRKSSKALLELNDAKAKLQSLELKFLTKAEQENDNRVLLNFKEANFPSNFIHGIRWKLMPKIDHLFSIGSPLAVFLVLRGMKPNDATSIDHILPEELCKHYYNIFHPSDPVVYRMEPLINEKYADVEPVTIYRLEDSQRVPYDMQKIKRNKTGSDGTSQEEWSVNNIPSCNGVHGRIRTLGGTVAGRLMGFFNRLRNHNSLNKEPTENHLQTLEEEITKADLENESTIKAEDNHHTVISQPAFRRRTMYYSLSEKRKLSSSHAFISRSSSFRNPRRRMPRYSSIFQGRTYYDEINNDSKNLTQIPETIPTVHHEKCANESESPNEDIVPPLFNSDNIHSTIVSPSSNSPDFPQLKSRIDYRLPESPYESSYLSVLTSHTSYWASAELINFMVSQIFDESDRTDALS